jgi:hypothetical protein
MIMAEIKYVFTDEHCLGFIELIDEGQWRAVGSRRSPGRVWLSDLGSFPTAEQARAAIRIRDLLSSRDD